MIYLCYWLIFC